MKEYQGKGIGTTFLKIWKNGRRKILSFGWSLLWNVIMKQQENYMKKVIFKVEGIRAKSMLVKGEVVDEYYMAKIL